MTAPELDLIACLRNVIGDEAYEHATRINASKPRDHVADLDEATLRLMHMSGAGSRSLRQQRRPARLRVDEYGNGNDGCYYAEYDGGAEEWAS